MKNIKKIIKKRWFKLLIALIAILVVGGIASYLTSHQTPQEKQEKVSRLFDQGQQLLSEKKYDECISKLSEALAIEPDNFNVNYTIGLAYYDKKDYANSEKYYNQAAATTNINQSTLAMVYNNLANTLRDSGQTDKAIDNYQRAIAVDKHMTFSYVNLATLYFGQGQVDQAVKLLQDGAEANPNSAEIKSLLKKYSQK